MEKRMSVFRRVVYIYFGFSGVVGIIATGFWHEHPLATIFHLTVMVASMNWGVLGITGKDIVEWIEIALKKN